MRLLDPSPRWAQLLLMLAVFLNFPAWGQEAGKTFRAEELDQMLAPIALYPDSLLSQVLMAATYPADVAEAAKWSKANPSQKGDAALKAVESQPWDPSVQSLVAFPQVIQMMGDKPDWVQNLGDAFLASSKDVLDSAQRLRSQAQKSGNLKTSEQQKVVVEQEPQTQQTVIKIEPANPQVVYVPAYNPTVVYGTWLYPAYPPVYYPPPPAYYPGAALATGIAFGVGVAATAALWGGCNWGHGDVDINVNKYNNVNVNRQLNANQTNFQHNAANRRGVPYRDQKSQQQFGKNVGGANQRADYRGRDPSRDAQRQQAQSALQQRGMDPGQGRDKLRTDPGTRERAQGAAQGAGAGGIDRDQARAQAQARGGGDRDQARAQGAGHVQDRPRVQDNAFSGANNPAQTRQQIDRGVASRQAMAQHTGGGGGRAGGGAAGGRAGGGGGFRGR
jgi:Protein of unknown function (DUF3300)